MDQEPEPLTVEEETIHDKTGAAIRTLIAAPVFGRVLLRLARAEPLEYNKLQ